MASGSVRSGVDMRDCSGRDGAARWWLRQGGARPELPLQLQFVPVKLLSVIVVEQELSQQQFPQQLVWRQ